jgi:hypothetical protein
VRDPVFYEEIAREHEADAERLVAAGNGDAAIREQRLAERHRKLAEAARDDR